MKIKFKYLVLVALISPMLAYGYAPNAYDNIQTTLEGDYTPNSYDNIITILDKTTATDSCTCPSINTNWAIALGDYCKINSDCNIGAGNITFTGTGNVTFNAAITAKGIGAIPANQKGYLGNMARVRQG